MRHRIEYAIILAIVLPFACLLWIIMRIMEMFDRSLSRKAGGS